MYTTIECNNVTVFDVDNTLVFWDKDFVNESDGKLQFNYGSRLVYLKPHSFHPTFLKHCFNRGDTVIVWSQNGYAWAEQVVHKLGLENHVTYIMSKPNRHIDDKDKLEDIVGNRVYINE